MELFWRNFKQHNRLHTTIYQTSTGTYICASLSSLNILSKCKIMSYEIKYTLRVCKISATRSELKQYYLRIHLPYIIIFGHRKSSAAAVFTVHSSSSISNGCDNGIIVVVAAVPAFATNAVLVKHKNKFVNILLFCRP